MMSQQQTKHTQTKIELNAEHWLRLLSGTYRNGNGNGHSANQAGPEFPVTELPAEYWIRILSGANQGHSSNGNGYSVNGAKPAEIDAEYWVRVLSGAAV